MKKFLFSVCSVLAILGCGGDTNGLPPIWQDDYGYNNYGYCRYNDRCEYMSVDDCYNYYGGSSYGDDSNCGNYGNYGYCRYNNECEYMSVDECYYYYGGSNYGGDNTCGNYGYPSSSSNRSSSSGSYTGSYGSVYYEGQSYKTVAIGTQTWMAENLNYAPNSGTFISCNTYDCSTYGRLYDWSTAMSLPSSCNSSTCSNQVQSKHRGICPNGWHIPSNDDWDKLFRYVDNVSGSGLYDSPTAGRYLKSTTGWNSGGNGTNQYGFSALPGG
ncbi:MAG: hypothetical protein LBQ76_05355, partial [Candidatus Fibromonas sp.]|nr:hypothetical protein [Candidatus Fibromonas sp.]